MSLCDTRTSITVVWLVLALLTFLSTGASSGPSWALLAIAGIVPPAVILALWKDGPPQAIADVERKS